MPMARLLGMAGTICRLYVGARPTPHLTRIVPSASQRSGQLSLAVILPGLASG
jgi:hypothetical protein